jgi:hypothetical protein
MRAPQNAIARALEQRIDGGTPKILRRPRAASKSTQLQPTLDCASLIVGLPSIDQNHLAGNFRFGSYD